ncbi:MAG: hypothetical protein D6809_01855 [Gammaproteobacteria bacterium]|nr:MAG: hypothetical protein D6809_01855 [Gammaproteobacteria bacterium]
MGFDDHGGPLPTHLWGILAEWNRPAGRGQWQAQLGLGAGPRLDARGLRPAEAVEPGGGGREALGLSWNWLPDAFGTDLLGLHAAYARIPSTAAGLRELRQASLGLFLDRGLGPSRWLADTLLLHHRAVTPTGVLRRWHGGAYLQVERAGGRWRPYARLERNVLDGEDPYWSLFPEVLTRRAVGGLRLELGEHHALAVEAGVGRELGGHRWRRGWRVQWSALLP